MLRLFDEYASLFRSWRVERFEQEGAAYMLHVSAILTDDSRLELRDCVFADGSRKYAYQWLDKDGRLRGRWDNAPHWPTVTTAPHHEHWAGLDTPRPSTITSLEDLFAFVREWLAQSGRAPLPR